MAVCFSGHSLADDWKEAVDEALSGALEGIEDEEAGFDLGLCFLSPEHAQWAADIAARFQDAARVEHSIGCVAQGVIATGRELEGGPALSLFLSRLPGATLESSHLRLEEREFEGLPDSLDDAVVEGGVLLLIPDPYTFGISSFLKQMNEEAPGVGVVGGLASGGAGSPLLLNGRTVQSGAVGVLLRGRLDMRFVVSQGCRPVGESWEVTKGQRNVVQELDGVPPMKRINALIKSLAEEDRRLLKRGVHIGRAIGDSPSPEGGEFLIGQLIGMDPVSGSIAITHAVRPGQRLQFHVRDSDTARQDLRRMLNRCLDSAGEEPSGCLLFSCNGRGSHMFPEGDNDAEGLRDVLGAVATAGFFAGGELGPVGGRNFVHGFTASSLIFF